MIYRIYTTQNLADTCRDPDYIHIEELGYKYKLDDALKILHDYIKNRFLHKDSIVCKTERGYQSTDFCSYGKTIIIESINVD